MPLGVLTEDQLEKLVDDYMDFDEFVFDVETKGPYRDEPHRNEVFWISLAGPGRADAIPCGHPVGERVFYDPDDETHRIAKNGHYQEHRINETSGRLKWFDIPAQFTPAPEQLWVSDVMRILRPLLFSKKKRKIGQNVRFDLESVAKYYNALPPPPYGDIIVAAKLVNENHFGYKLGEIVKRLFYFEYEKIGKAGPERFSYSEAYLYSYYDAKYEWLAWNHYDPLLEKENVAHIFDIEMDVLTVILDMERAGITLDEERLAELGVLFSKEMARLMVDIEKANGGPINLNANRQVAELVYDKLKHPCKVFTPSGERSTASDTLESFHKDPIVKKLGEHAKFSKLQSSFVVNLQNRVHEKKVHPSVNQVGARTGRSSVSEPNIQQIPVRSEDGKRVREVFVASPGNVLIVSDLSQIELRVLGHFTQDKQLLRAYRNNLDLHALLAARVFGENFTPIDRLYAKNGNFCVPMDTEALTKGGWKTYDQLSIGDEVAAYKDGVLTWTPILHLWKFDDAPLVSLENNHFKAVTTPEHRWVGEHRKQYGHGKTAVRRWERAEITTGSVMSEDRIFLSAPLDENSQLKINPEEAALIGWLWTDGSINRGKLTGKTSQSHGKKVAFRAEIFQSKADGIIEVESLLKKLDVKFRHLERPAKRSLAGEELRPIHVWAIDPAYMRDLWSRALLDELTPVQFITHLGSSHIQCFVDACWLAEGWQDKKGGLIMAQNEGPIYEAMSLAVFLNGYFPNICSNGVFKGTENFNIRFGKPYVNGTRLKKTPLPSAPVWCLNNALGSWVMRQGQQISLTGNSVLFGAAAPTLVRRYGFPNVRLAQQVIDGFYATYKRVEPWKEEVLTAARRKYRKGISPPYVTTILGRKRRLPELNSSIRGVRAGAERQAISSIIQGSAADLFKLAMIDCHELLQKQKWEAHILMTVHDELVVEVPERYAEAGLTLVRESMEQVKNPFTDQPILSLPVVADAKIVKRWSDAK